MCLVEADCLSRLSHLETLVEAAKFGVRFPFEKDDLMPAACILLAQALVMVPSLVELIRLKMQSTRFPDNTDFVKFTKTQLLEMSDHVQGLHGVAQLTARVEMIRDSIARFATDKDSLEFVQGRRDKGADGDAWQSWLSHAFASKLLACMDDQICSTMEELGKIRDSSSKALSSACETVCENCDAFLTKTRATQQDGG